MANKSLEALKMITSSLAGAIPGVSDEEREKIAKHLLRVTSGVASQVYGLNDQGEPEFGSRPGIVNEMVALPELVPSLLEGSAALNSAVGLDSYSNSQKKLAELAAKYMPDAVGKASEKTDKLHRAIREGVGLSKPHGFTENAEDALGVMAGQLPVPGSLVKKLSGAVGKSAPRLASTLAASPLEWLSPTIDPKLSNYLSGALFGGTTGTAADALSPVDEKAEGGRVDTLNKLLKWVSLNPLAKKGETAHLLEDPLENVKYASYEAAQSGKIHPDQQKSFNQLIESYLNGDTTLTDEGVADQLMALHRKLFGDSTIETPVNNINNTPRVPEAFGVRPK